LLTTRDANISLKEDDNERYEEYKRHEFEVVQTQRSKMLRAARLAKTAAMMESVPSAHSESELIADQLRKEDSARSDYPVPPALSIYQRDITIDRPFNSLVTQITHTRRQAQTIKQQVLYLKSSKERDQLLLKMFLVYNMPAMLQPVALHAFFHERNLPLEIALSLLSRRRRLLLVLLGGCYIAAHLGGSLYFTISIALSVGVRAEALWMVVFWLAVGLDGLVVQTAKLYVKWILLVNWQLGKHLRAMSNILFRRTKLVLLRSSGLLRDSSCLLQHLNPACRVARELPELHVSRLLISLGDGDVAIYRNKSRARNSGVSSLLGTVPFWCSDLLGEMALVALLGAGLYGMLRLYEVNLYAFIAVSIALLLLVLLSHHYKLLLPPLTRLAQHLTALLRRLSVRSMRTVYQDFYDISSVKDEVKDDDQQDGEMSISTKGSFGSRRNRYKPGHSALTKLPNPLAPIEEYLEESSTNKPQPAGFKKKLQLGRLREKPPPTTLQYTGPTLTATSLNSEPLAAYPSHPNHSSSAINTTSSSSATKLSRRQGRRVARNEQKELTAGPGSPPAKYSSQPPQRGFNINNDKKMINSATALSDLLLVSSDAHLPSIDILSNMMQDGSNNINKNLLEQMIASAVDNNGQELGPGGRQRFSLFVDDDNSPLDSSQQQQASGVNGKELSEQQIHFD